MKQIIQPMSNNQNMPVVLVYFKIRGKLQPIRTLIAYLKIQFIEVHLEDDQQKKKLPIQVVNMLKGIKIQKLMLPLLVHEGMYIYETYPIMAYLCRKFQHEELLGRDIFQKAKLQEILQIMIIKSSYSMCEIIKLADLASEISEEQIMMEKKATYERLLNESGYIREICTYLEQQRKEETYVLGTITLIDFYFLETCHYILGYFNNLDTKLRCPITHIFMDLFSCGDDKSKQTIKYLKILRDFMNFFTKQPFYADNRQTLQSKSMICGNFSPKRVKGMRKLWVLNPKFVS